ncbi:MAG: hypothetical protein HYW49_09735 [Deltaproteobacteria bacterium]|nr:hypothetical protein [Deltaproteobacteria bacterium]
MAVVKKASRFALICLLSSSFAVTAMPKPAYAMDKKVLVMFRTAGYGAGAGLLVGAATWTMGIGTSRNLMVGASLGLYAGILFGVYILATQEEPVGRPESPWRPKRPVGPEDWKNEPQDDMSRVRPATLERRLTFAQTPAAAVWTPVISVSF